MEKYMFLRHYRIENKAFTGIHQRVMGVLPFCLLVHWISSWWFYGSPGILGNCCYSSERSALSIKSLEVRMNSRYGVPCL